ncbi:uncharacterized protein THITE_111359 [Thermothielavioides terrestris NRRL 8126]|uniref:Uncharacterized protein n=1 Tax=Thermothielavioides terrestris (strain ATCC 38088 / NRRL 8126) TaxID=578455 RepID=G2R0F5_THETT|nr:uncharacterized protein THITE_111359 [Thermothielavioides terrestris NRRL 8126]AEO65620.1 hypothetical protein THITE_111359 [Thermothielavioides terrestris NRRL 8126]
MTKTSAKPKTIIAEIATRTIVAITISAMTRKSSLRRKFDKRKLETPKVTIYQVKEAPALESNDGIDSPLGNYTYLHIAIYAKEEGEELEVYLDLGASRSIISYNLLNLLNYSIERYKGKLVRRIVATIKNTLYSIIKILKQYLVGKIHEYEDSGFLCRPTTSTN